MRSYRQLFRTAEFTPLFVASCAQVAASTLTSLSLGTLVYARTESPLLSALAMFGPSIAQLIGANTLLSIADRVPPRAALTTMATIAGMAGLILAIPGMPLAAMFVIVFALSLPASISGGARFALVTEILSPQGYLLGRSMLNMAVGSCRSLGSRPAVSLSC
uniref:hypothetical protein n=1 Tax=Paractinoplanes polyasparticus TaxID=2856853 RepID=UPI00210842A7|nr:hypothetical protein [Actinoplanes polyasparticus]